MFFISDKALPEKIRFVASLRGIVELFHSNTAHGLAWDNALGIALEDDTKHPLPELLAHREIRPIKLPATMCSGL